MVREGPDGQFPLRAPGRIDAAQGQLVSLLSQGLKNKEIATTLMISEGTVKVYLSRLFQKVGVKDRFELALFGLKNLTTGDGPAAKGSPSGRNAGAPVARPRPSRGAGTNRNRVSQAHSGRFSRVSTRIQFAVKGKGGTRRPPFFSLGAPTHSCGTVDFSLSTRSGPKQRYRKRLYPIEFHSDGPVRPCVSRGVGRL